MLGYQIEISFTMFFCPLLTHVAFIFRELIDYGCLQPSERFGYLCHRRCIKWRLCFYSCLFVCLSLWAGYLKKLWTDSDEILWTCCVGNKDELIWFWWRSGSRSEFFLVILQYWEIGPRTIYCIARYLKKVMDGFGWNSLDELDTWQEQSDGLDADPTYQWDIKCKLFNLVFHVIPVMPALHFQLVWNTWMSNEQ